MKMCFLARKRLPWPGVRDSFGEGNGNPLQYSCLENPRDRGAWRAIAHSVAKSWTQLGQLSTKELLCYETSCWSWRIRKEFEEDNSDGDKVWQREEQSSWPGRQHREEEWETRENTVPWGQDALALSLLNTILRGLVENDSGWGLQTMSHLQLPALPGLFGKPFTTYWIRAQPLPPCDNWQLCALRQIWVNSLTSMWPSFQ